MTHFERVGVGQGDGKHGHVLVVVEACKHLSNPHYYDFSNVKRYTDLIVTSSKRIIICNRKHKKNLHLLYAYQANNSTLTAEEFEILKLDSSITYCIHQNRLDLWGYGWKF